MTKTKNKLNFIPIEQLSAELGGLRYSMYSEIANILNQNSDSNQHEDLLKNYIGQFISRNFTTKKDFLACVADSKDITNLVNSIDSFFENFEDSESQKFKEQVIKILEDVKLASAKSKIIRSLTKKEQKEINQSADSIDEFRKKHTATENFITTENPSSTNKEVKLLKHEFKTNISRILNIINSKNLQELNQLFKYGLSMDIASKDANKARAIQQKLPDIDYSILMRSEHSLHHKMIIKDFCQSLDSGVEPNHELLTRQARFLRKNAPKNEKKVLAQLLDEYKLNFENSISIKEGNELTKISKKLLKKTKIKRAVLWVGGKLGLRKSKKKSTPSSASFIDDTVPETISEILLDDSPELDGQTEIDAKTPIKSELETTQLEIEDPISRLSQVSSTKLTDKPEIEISQTEIEDPDIPPVTATNELRTTNPSSPQPTISEDLIKVKENIANEKLAKANKVKRTKNKKVSELTKLYETSIKSSHESQQSLKEKEYKKSIKGKNPVKDRINQFNKTKSKPIRTR